MIIASVIISVVAGGDVVTSGDEGIEVVVSNGLEGMVASWVVPKVSSGAEDNWVLEVSFWLSLLRVVEVFSSTVAAVTVVSGNIVVNSGIGVALPSPVVVSGICVVSIVVILLTSVVIVSTVVVSITGTGVFDAIVVVIVSFLALLVSLKSLTF